VTDDDSWDLSDLYPSPEAFEAAREELTKSLESIAAFRGTLGDSAAALWRALDAVFSSAKELARLTTYANLRSDEDTRVPETLAVRQEVQQLAADHASATSWVSPEILALPAGTVEAFLDAEPGLAPYRFFLFDLERQRTHTLSPAEERLLAEAGMLAQAPSSLYTVLANADLPFPEVQLSDGRTVRLDHAAYAKHRTTSERSDRKLVFDRFWAMFEAYQRTFGVALDAQIRRDVFFARARRYPSSLAAALDVSNVPEAVYRALIAEATRALPLLHRLFRLRGTMLGVDDQRYYDVYPPVVPALEREYTIDEAKALVARALGPLGAGYVEALRRGFASRWMDVFPHPGKRAGAYSAGSAYDVHPYVLMNYNGDYESVSTLAHEWGHTMHSFLANGAQPYPTAGYPIFIAEVASTFNEALLLDAMLVAAGGDEMRLFLLGSYLEHLRATFFRQAMFAEFELAIHETVEGGGALTGAVLSELYGGLLRRYHGHDQGVVAIDDAYFVEWAYVPHFYYNFYVYQYATSLAASTMLADEILSRKEGARERYLGLLQAGGSRYPYELLADAGVDLATPEPYRALTRRLDWAMNEIEAILTRAGSARQ
jgi:oligoendopeptidase F